MWSHNLCTVITSRATSDVLGRRLFANLDRSRARLQGFRDQGLCAFDVPISIYVYLEMHAEGLRPLPPPFRFDALAPAARARARALQRHRAHGHPWRR